MARVETLYRHQERLSTMRMCSPSTIDELRRLGRLPTKPAWLKLAVYDALNDKPMSLKRERRMCAALGLEPITRKRYWRPCLPVNLSADQKRRIMKITEE